MKKNSIRIIDFTLKNENKYNNSMFKKYFSHSHTIGSR